MRTLKALDEAALHHLHEQARYTRRIANILNLEKGEYAGEGLYGIPAIEPVYELPEIREWINFGQVLQDKEPEGKAVHFFIDDYQFERIWNAPEKYVKKLKQYVCIASPEFSTYGGMPFVLQLYNHYRKHWVAAYMQDHGVNVIATIMPSLNPEPSDWSFCGEPRGSIVIIACQRLMTDEQREQFRCRYGAMYKELNPSKIFVYGTRLPDLPGNIEFLKPYTEEVLRKRVPDKDRKQRGRKRNE